MSGPLAGVRIIEFAGIGPAPFCGMMLADHGAEIIRIDRIGAAPFKIDPLSRSKKSIAVDTKTQEGVAVARRLAASADGLIEGYRPGVMERLGLGPDSLLADNPRLVYGRMTGWGQSGPYANAAGHDINYIALSGALHTCGRAGEKPTPPVNYLGDFGGGGMLLAFGMASALFAVRSGAPGQIIDCAMTEGSALLTAMTRGFFVAGLWRDERGVNIIDTGAHFYDTFETRDGEWISIGAIEPQFYALLREKTGVADDPAFDAQHDRARWPDLKAKLAAIFKRKSRAEWEALLQNTDVCFAPVLSLEEAPGHPHNVARETFIDLDGAAQPAPAPRYSATIADRPRPAPAIGADTDAILSSLGYDDQTIAELRKATIVA